jgi:hypothetical protein
MIDIVERLRAAKGDWKIGVEICDEAAAEIERLREEVRQAQIVHDSYAAENQRFHDEIERGKQMQDELERLLAHGGGILKELCGKREGK